MIVFKESVTVATAQAAADSFNAAVAGKGVTFSVTINRETVSGAATAAPNPTAVAVSLTTTPPTVNTTATVGSAPTESLIALAVKPVRPPRTVVMVALIG